MKIAYLVNQYPSLSHSFIRREIAAIESAGEPVVRYSVRPTSSDQTDRRDREEHAKTRAILGQGAVKLLLNMLTTAIHHPIRFCQTLRFAWHIGKRSERGRLKHLIYVMEACTLRQWAKQDGVTHIHAHFGTNSTTVAMLTHALGGPVFSFTCHGSEEYEKPQFIALPQKIRRAAFVASISDFGRSQLYRWSQYEDWPKIHVVRCGVDELFLTPAAQQKKPNEPNYPVSAAPATDIPNEPNLQASDDKADSLYSGLSSNRLITVGRLTEQKGQMLLVEAVAQLKNKGIPLHLTLIGDGRLRKPLEALIAQCGLENEVALAGSMSNDQVRQHILESRALIMSSFSEGLPVVIMEALALRRPVLSTYISGIPELVEQGKNGWLIRPGSIEALVEGMQQVLSCPVEQLRQMGEYGAQQVAKKHNSQIEGAKMLKLIRQYSKN